MAIHKQKLGYHHPSSKWYHFKRTEVVMVIQATSACRTVDCASVESGDGGVPNLNSGSVWDHGGVTAVDFGSA